MFHAYNFRTKQPAKKVSTKTFSITDAWAAIAFADRVNQGQYVNEKVYFKPGEIVKHHNKTLAWESLAGNEEFQITEQDREQGKIMSEHFAGLLFHSLKTAGVSFAPSGGSGFMSKISEIVAMKQVGKYEVACMSALPVTYRREIAREAAKEKMFKMSAQSDYIGMPGSRIETNLEVIDTFYSQKYSSLIVTAAVDNNIVKFFSTKDVENFNKGASITVKGTVKHTSVNDRTGGKETWLTRVKVVG